MIIGISGKMQSGKDTVASIIQYLTCIPCGINYTLEEWLKLDNTNIVLDTIEPNWQIKKFAGKLKEIISLLTGYSLEDLERQEIKDTILGEEWQKELTSGLFRENGSFGKTKLTVRDLLQLIGTDLMRNQLHPNVWVNALMTDYKLTDTGKPIEENNWAYCINNGENRFVTKKNNNRSNIRTFTDDGTLSKKSPSEFCHEEFYHKGEYPNWLITDVRFENEAQAILDKGSVLIRVERPCEECGVIQGHKMIPHKNTPSTHESETALDNYKGFKYHIQNDGTIDDLIKSVRQILLSENIL